MKVKKGDILLQMTTFWLVQKIKSRDVIIRPWDGNASSKIIYKDELDAYTKVKPADFRLIKALFL